MRPDHFQVTWWPGPQPEADINSASTADDFLLLEGLRPATMYTVVVEARRLQRYSHLSSDSAAAAADSAASFILSGRAEALALRTAQPPEPPANLGVVATTCHSLLVAWDPPRERGAEVRALRLECWADGQALVIHEVLPDTRRTLLSNLSEKTAYRVIIRAVTDEFFHLLPADHPVRLDSKLPADIPRLIASLANGAIAAQWLPSDSLHCSTSGTTPASGMEVIRCTVDVSVNRSLSVSMIYDFGCFVCVDLECDHKVAASCGSRLQPTQRPDCALDGSCRFGWSTYVHW